MLCLTPNVVMKVSWRVCVFLSRDIIALIRWRNVMSYDLVISYLPCENFISQRFTTLSPRSITKSHCIPSCWAFGSSSSLQGISKASFVSALASFVGSSPLRVYGASEVLTAAMPNLRLICSVCIMHNSSNAIPLQLMTLGEFTLCSQYCESPLRALSAKYMLKRQNGSTSLYSYHIKLSQILLKWYKMAELWGLISAIFGIFSWCWLKNCLVLYRNLWHEVSFDRRQVFTTRVRDNIFFIAEEF